MDSIQGVAGSASAMAKSVLEDTAGAQLITKTLDKVNGSVGPASANGTESTYQFVKDVMGAAGIGMHVDTKA